MTILYDQDDWWIVDGDEAGNQSKTGVFIKKASAFVNKELESSSSQSSSSSSESSTKENSTVTKSEKNNTINIIYPPPLNLGKPKRIIKAKAKTTKGKGTKTTKGKKS